MKNFTSKMALLLTALGLSSLASTATANDYLRINRAARTIERKANLLAGEVVHYQAMPQYCQLTDDLEDFVRLSQHITDLVRVSGNVRHIKSDVNELDRTFHHIEGVFDRIERQIARGRGYKYGNTAHVKRLLNDVEDCIHHMQEDIAILEVRVRRERYDRPVYGSSRGINHGVYDRTLNRTVYNPPVYNRPVYNTPAYHRPVYSPPRPTYRGGSRNSCPSSGGGVGITIGGGSSRIHFRF